MFYTDTDHEGRKAQPQVLTILLVAYGHALMHNADCYNLSV